MVMEGDVIRFKGNYYVIEEIDDSLRIKNIYNDKKTSISIYAQYTTEQVITKLYWEENRKLSESKNLGTRIRYRMHKNLTFKGGYLYRWYKNNCYIFDDETKQLKSFNFDMLEVYYD